MANQPGQARPDLLRQGTILTADQMNRIMRALVRRIEGGKGIKVRSFGGRIIIESSDA